MALSLINTISKIHHRSNSEPPPAVPSCSTAPVAVSTPEVPATAPKLEGYAPPLTSYLPEPEVTTLSGEHGAHESAAIPNIMVFPTPEVAPVPLQENERKERGEQSPRNSTSGSFFPKGTVVPIGDDDDLMAKLTVITADINESKRNSSKREQAVNAPDDKMAAVQGLENGAIALLSPIKTAAGLPAFSGAMKTLKQGMPLLMKGLDEVAKIHPFIGVAVLAFKSVYGLEMTRRSNEKKVVALYVQMKDTIYMLLQLKDVRDPSDKGPDGVTIQGRLQSLVDQTAADLKSCGNACDTYSKMRLLTKVIKGPIWDGTLASFVTRFVGLRSEFEFALSIHTGRGVDEANRKLDKLSAELRETHEMFTKMMETLVSPEQRKLAEAVKSKGGPKRIMEDDKLLQELSVQGSKKARAMVGDSQKKDNITKLKMELRADPAEVIKTNVQAFEGKFVIQQRQIVEDIDRAMKRESDRVIELVTSGPHDRIVDKDLHTLWRDMGWRGSVKARHFVLALRDYYHDREEEIRRKAASFEAAIAVNSDTWALEYLNIKRLQQIADFFDEDASGFITIAEVNKLIAARPLEWSLPHWIAYWSVGWQMAASEYANKIHAIFSKMFQLKETVQSGNIRYVNQYLTNIWIYVVELTMAIKPHTTDEDLIRRFETHTSSEEERLRKNLENIHFAMDDQDTLRLVTGPGGIERYLFPVLYLLLKRDFEIFKIAQTSVLNKDELRDSTQTICYVFWAVSHRVYELLDAFTHRKLDPEQQFKDVYSGLYQYWHSWEGSDFLRELQRKGPIFTDYEDSEDQGVQDVDPSTVLNYPLEHGRAFDYKAYDVVPFVENESDKKSEAQMLRTLIGRWYCVLGTGDEWPSQSMFSIDIHISADGQKLEGSGKVSDGNIYVMIGTLEADDNGCTTLVMTQTFADGPWTTDFCINLTDSSSRGNTLTGFYGDPSAVDKIDPFILSRLQPEILIHRPSPEEFLENRVEALWQFAISATRDQVRRRFWSWSHFKARFQMRKRYIELALRSWDYGRRLDEDETVELARCHKALSPADARFYRTIGEYQLRTASVHEECCDACGGTICGTRVICLACDNADSVDLCNDDRCLAATISTDERDDLTESHVPLHPVYKVRKPVHMRHSAKLDNKARIAMKRALEVLEDVEDVEAEQREGAVEARDKTTMLASDQLTCAVCKTRMCLPCWYCISCPDNTFLCLACDPEDGIAVGCHEKNHPLVRVHEQVEELDIVTMDDRIGAIEGRMEATEGKLALLDARVDDRLSRMEHLLHLMLGHFGVDSPSDMQAIQEAPQESQGSAPVDSERDNGQGAACMTEISSTAGAMVTGATPNSAILLTPNMLLPSPPSVGALAGNL